MFTAGVPVANARGIVHGLLVAFNNRARNARLRRIRVGQQGGLPEPGLETRLSTSCLRGSKARGCVQPDGYFVQTSIPRLPASDAGSCPARECPLRHDLYGRLLQSGWGKFRRFNAGDFHLRACRRGKWRATNAGMRVMFITLNIEVAFTRNRMFTHRSLRSIIADLTNRRLPQSACHHDTVDSGERCQ